MGLPSVSKEAADGTPRYHAWDPELKQERKSIIKMLLIAFACLLVA